MSKKYLLLWCLLGLIPCFMQAQIGATYPTLHSGIESINASGRRLMGGYSDPQDPGSWTDPFGGNTGGEVGDIDDPTNWTDPFSQQQEVADPYDPTNWADPFSHVPVGDVPWLLMSLLSVGYSIYRFNRHKQSVG